MDIPRFVRRMSSYGEDSTNQFAAVAPSSRASAGLTVDTSVAKASFRTLNSIERNTKDGEPQWGDETLTPSSHSSRHTTPTSTRGDDALRRRRSNSECLLLAKNGEKNLPGPCKEYISSVKQILARSDESRPLRRRSMSMRTNPVVNPGIVG